MKFSRYTLDHPSMISGAEGIRTPDPLLARQVLSQLSYTPMYIWVDSSAAKFTSFTKDADVPTTRFKLRLRLVFIKFSGNGLKWTFPSSECLSKLWA